MRNKINGMPVLVDTWQGRAIFFDLKFLIVYD